MEPSAPSIPESFIEHRQTFADSWVDKWGIPNPFISPLLATLRSFGVELTDFSFNKDGASLGELSLNVSIRSLNAAVRIGLDRVTFVVSNPDWGMVPKLTDGFDAVSERIYDIVHLTPKSQETTLAFHVTPGSSDFRAATASLVNPGLTSECVFSGISLHRKDSALVIDKSLRYEGAAFVRIQLQSPGDATFADIAATLYDEEVSALRLLGVTGLI